MAIRPYKPTSAGRRDRVAGAEEGAAEGPQDEERDAPSEPGVLDGIGDLMVAVEDAWAGSSSMAPG